MSKATVLTDHNEIRQWMEERDGRPVRVKDTADNEEGGILRIDFGDPDEGLEKIAWDEFFEIFDRDLGLLCGTEAESRFDRFVDRS